MHFYKGQGSQCFFELCQLCGLCPSYSTSSTGVKAAKEHVNKYCGYSSIQFLLLKLVAAGLAGGSTGCVYMCLDKLEISFSNFLTYCY